jgi:hypothetical protein
MVELKVEPIDCNLGSDYYVSVRVGEVQKLSRVSPSRAYKFPASAVGQRKYGKIEIFKKVNSSAVGLTTSGNGDDVQEVNMKLDDDSIVKFQVSVNAEGKPTAKAPQEKQPATKEANPKVAAAKSYLEKHNLEMRLSEAMQAVLREKPEDPATFVSEMLAKSAGMVQKLSKTGKAPPTVPAAPPPAAAPPAAAAPAAAIPVAAASAAPATKVLPFGEYHNANFKVAPASVWQGLYSAFPGRAAAPAAPAAAAAASKAEGLTAVDTFFGAREARCAQPIAFCSLLVDPGVLNASTTPVDTFVNARQARVSQIDPGAQFNSLCAAIPNLRASSVEKLAKALDQAAPAAGPSSKLAAFHQKPSVGTWVCVR